MADFKRRPIYIPFAGPALLEAPLLNKGSAFTERERQQFNLEGLLPYKIETIQEQKTRAYHQFGLFESNIDKHIYLRNIQDTNETLYFKLVIDHLEEIMPLIYTPTVGLVCQQFSKIYRRKRGLFISYPDRDRMHDLLQNATKQNVKVIVVTDGERILGLGDQGIGGMGIPIGKLSLYTACGGISPAYVMPIMLDVGTNNKALMSDPMYMGWKHERIAGDDYYQFVDEFIQAVKMRWPQALLQFEDFAIDHATPLLKRYRNELCCFNDDIQGTAAVTVGTLIAACKSNQEKLSDQTIMFAGAGSAGVGIAEYIAQQMVDEGLSLQAARERIFLVNVDGLLTVSSKNLHDFHEPWRVSTKRLVELNLSQENSISLLEAVKKIKPSVLIGVSGQHNLFSQEIIETMAANCAVPIVLPLSNPTSQVEATPNNIMQWTKGRAIVATGSPFDPVHYQEKKIEIAQCNNAYIFPGLGLGVISAKASRVTDAMLMAASRELAASSPLANNGQGPLLPPLNHIRELSKKIAVAVFKQAIEDEVALPLPEHLIVEKINKNFWDAEYREYRRTSF